MYHTMCAIWIMIVTISFFVFVFAIKETIKDIKNTFDDDNY